ncbi:hypothetical protein AOLI_G00096960 [Acnodon oligacanthus]
MKADVLPSQCKTCIHSTWVPATSTGITETVRCCCIAGEGKSYSHAAVILWKVQSAESKGLTGMFCTDEQLQWNSGTHLNLAPKRLSDPCFKQHKEGKAPSRLRSGRRQLRFLLLSSKWLPSQAHFYGKKKGGYSSTYLSSSIASDACQNVKCQYVPEAQYPGSTISKYYHSCGADI